MRKPKISPVAAATFCAMMAAAHVASLPASGMEIIRTFTEVAQSADLIFYGAVGQISCRLSPNGKMIFTDVCFRDVQVIHQAPDAEPVIDAVTTLSFAGGDLGDTHVRVSDIPEFTIGRWYLLYANQTEAPVICPLSGGSQGLFHLVKDAQTDQWYPLTYARRGITGISEKGELRLTRAIEYVSSGVTAFTYESRLPESQIETSVPVLVPLANGPGAPGAAAAISGFPVNQSRATPPAPAAQAMTSARASISPVIMRALKDSDFGNTPILTLNAFLNRTHAALKAKENAKGAPER